MARCLLILLSLLLSNAVVAGEPPAKSWTFTIHMENDLFSRTDRFYTNGVKLSWISPEMEYFRDLKALQGKGLPRSTARGIIDMLPFSREEGLQRNMVISVGQMMYTPTDIERHDLIVTDRPYGGWLYASFSFHNKNKKKLNSIELQAGVIGPWSLAREAQNYVHDVRGIPRAQGWDNQLENELGLAFVVDRKQRYLASDKLVGLWGYDVITHYGGALGNVFTHLNAGMEMRVGWNIPADFGTALIRPAGDTNAPTTSDDPRYHLGFKGFSYYLFAGVTGRLVMRDVFLDGNTFRDSHRVDRESMVGDIIFGGSITWRRFKFSYAQVVRSKEFELQQSGHHFGSMTLSYTY